MANRTGIELLPSHCRLIEVQGAPGAPWPRSGGQGAGVQARAFRSIPFSSGSPAMLAAELRQLLSTRAFSRRAVAVVWGLRSTHQYLLLPPAELADLENLARREARAAGAPAAGSDAEVSDGILVGEVREAPGGGSRREVSYVAVPAEEVRARVRPLAEAGFTVDAAVTPAVAHAALARRRPSASPDGVTAVLEVNAHVSGLTVVRGGLVLFAREMPWGHESEQGVGQALDPQVFAARLAAELRRSFLYLKQNQRVDPVDVLVCGDMPDLRTITGPLMQELGIDVETLDSVDGFDADHLPEPAAEFRFRVAAYRPAAAMAAESAFPVNLLPRAARAAADARRLQARFAAAVLAAVLLVAAGWSLTWWLGSSVRRDGEASRRRIAVLEPEVQRLDQARLAAALAVARGAALDAWAVQGPRLARVLEVLGQSAPGEVAISSLTLEPNGAAWTLKVEGQALAPSPVLAQSAFNQFLHEASRSALLGEPVRPPVLKVRAGPTPEQQAAMAAAAAPGTLTAPRVAGSVADQPDTVPGYYDVRPWNVMILDEGRNEERAAAAAARGTGAGAYQRGTSATGAPRQFASPGTAGQWRSGTTGDTRTVDARRRALAIEPQWYMHPLGGPPREEVERVAALQDLAAGTSSARSATIQAAAPPPAAPRPGGATLDFSIEFEVRK